VQLAELAKVIDRNRRNISVAPVDEAVGYDKAPLERLVSVAGRSGVAIVLGAMIDTAPGLAEGLRDALKNADQKECRRHAHVLKTNAQTVGAYSLARQFQELESLSDAGRLEEISAKAPAALQSYEQLVESMLKLRAQYQ
jgi:HPt (histidine-containing phosphotransfer) domain-containing protein